MKPTNKHIKLDWNKLLGFNQVKRTERDLSSKSDIALIRAKVGQVKEGLKYVA